MSGANLHRIIESKRLFAYITPARIRDIVISRCGMSITPAIFLFVPRNDRGPENAQKERE